MTREFTSADGLHVMAGGEGDRLLVLLHGLGANGSVWRPLVDVVASRWRGRLLIPTFRGHGLSTHSGPYGYGKHAADVADLIAAEDARNVVILGHSFGGLVGALVGSGLFGPPVRCVFGLGVKIEWSADEIAGARRLADRRAKPFATHAEAAERYLKVAGLHGLPGITPPDVAAGVVACSDGFHVTLDPAVYSAVGPPVETLLRLCVAPLRLAAGANDPMVTLAAMRRIDPAARLIDGAGHNAHWEAPDAVWRFIEDSLDR